MPEIKLQHVVSVSGEDKNYPADNLLKSESFKKWKSGSVGDKQVSVTLQFEKASQIHQIDIGNDGSAFVEVLVGRSAMKDEEYQVILVASSFMNPMESRSGQNLNRVRIFGAEKLSKVTLDHKWDRVKVICTQPFNKTTQYGLAFIKFHSPPTEADKEADATEMGKKTFGAFSVRSSGDDGIQQGSLFARRGKEPVQTTPLTGAAAGRAASKLAEESRAERGSSHTAGVVSQRVDLTTGALSKLADSQKHTSKQLLKRSHSHGEERRGDREGKQSSEHRHPHTSAPSVTGGSTCSTPPPLKKARNETAVIKKKQLRTLPLAEVMGRVVFMMSGFQNPQRGQLRDKALQMGARYQGEWNQRCTHLICAFKNTPKYNQVNGKVRIVTKDWVLDCHTRRQLLPWRQYRLGSAVTPPGSSEEEEEEEEEDREQGVRRPSAQTSQSSQKPHKPDNDTANGKSSPVVSSDSEDAAEEEMPCPKKNEFERKNDDVDPFEVSTDDDNASSSGGELPELPDFFTDKCFFFYGAMAPTERRTLLRYVTAYNGIVEDYMKDGVNFVVTNSQWDDNFDDALTDNPNVMFVHPDWIEMCHENQRLEPFQKYIVMPR